MPRTLSQEEVMTLHVPPSCIKVSASRPFDRTETGVEGSDRVLFQIPPRVTPAPTPGKLTNIYHRWPKMMEK